MRPDNWRARLLATGLAFVVIAILVQVRALAGLDARVLPLVDAARPAALEAVLNWAYRLAFVQVDLVVAAGWVVWRLRRGETLGRALAPAVLVVVVAVQVAARLLVEQPPPDHGFALQRTFADQALSSVLDRGDLLGRDAFQSATATSQAASSVPTFPSGHAARALFLALLFAASVAGGARGAAGARGRVWWRLAALAGLGWAALVGYSVLYFGYHWPSDVLAGYLLAIGGWQLAESPLLPAVVSGVAGQRSRLSAARSG